MRGGAVRVRLEGRGVGVKPQWGWVGVGASRVLPVLHLLAWGPLARVPECPCSRVCMCVCLCAHV